MWMTGLIARKAEAFLLAVMVLKKTSKEMAQHWGCIKYKKVILKVYSNSTSPKKMCL